MEELKIKLGDIVKAKFGNSVLTYAKEDGSTNHCNIEIWGIVTDITPNKETGQSDILVKLMFDANSFHTYKSKDLSTISSINLIKVPIPYNLELIRQEFLAEDICMSDFLASIPAAGLTLEEAFKLYIGARRWADGDRFFVDKDEHEIEELEF